MDAKAIQDLINAGGFPTLLCIAFAYLARLYVGRVQDEIDYLRKEIADLRSELAAIRQTSTQINSAK